MTTNNKIEVRFKQGWSLVPRACGFFDDVSSKYVHDRCMKLDSTLVDLNAPYVHNTTNKFSTECIPATSRAEFSVLPKTRVKEVILLE